MYLVAISQTKIGDGWTVEGLILGIVILAVAIVAIGWLWNKIFG